MATHASKVDNFYTSFQKTEVEEGGVENTPSFCNKAILHAWNEYNLNAAWCEDNQAYEEARSLFFRTS